VNKGQKAWEYNHTEHAWPVCHVFMPGNSDYNRWPVLKQKLNLVQQVESNNHLRGGVFNLYNTKETSWLTAAHKMGYRYACIWFDGCWADVHDFNRRLLDEIDRLNRVGDWLCAGQIQARTDEYPFFTRSMVLVKLQTWQDVDQPNPHIRPPEFPGYVVTPSEWEDSVYSVSEVPTELSERDLSRLIYNKAEQFANAWISWSLRRHLIVPGLSDNFMETVTYTRPLNGTEEFQKGITGLEYDSTDVSHQAKRIIKRLNDVQSPVYFVNTELSKPEIVEQLVGTSFEQYVGPAAGFKLLYYAYKYGVNSNTRFVFYDFDADSVRFRRDTLTGWDGEDYRSWVNLWCDANPGVNDQLRGLVDKRWPELLQQFGGLNSWLEFWDKIQQCETEVLHLDLIHESERLLKNLAVQRTFFWSSNIYSYMPLQLKCQPFEIEKSFINIVSGLNNIHPDCWFSGTDINDNDLLCPARAVLSVGNNSNIGFEV